MVGKALKFDIPKRLAQRMHILLFHLSKYSPVTDLLILDLGEKLENQESFYCCLK
jgi:hypothetical protein